MSKVIPFPFCGDPAAICEEKYLIELERLNVVLGDLYSVIYGYCSGENELDAVERMNIEFNRRLKSLSEK